LALHFSHTYIREWAIVAAGLELRGEDVFRLLLQDLQSIGAAVFMNHDDSDSDVAACQRHLHDVGLLAQAGVVFVLQEGQECFARLKSDSASTIAIAPGALVFEGNWCDVFDSVMSHLKSLL
jgi:hypothetical protein